MDQQQTIFNMVDEMGSILLTLQTDMIKVMNGINQLNIIITKIKQYKANNNMMNNMNNNMMNNMNNNMMNNMNNNMMNNMNNNMMNNMNNNMLSNMMNNMKNMNIGMNNMIGFQDMNMKMPMNAMMNNMNIFNQITLDDENGWKLIFEDQSSRKEIEVKISKEKLFKEAINIYKIKSMREGRMKFIFNDHEIYPETKISETRLNNMSKILVISLQDLKGG